MENLARILGAHPFLKGLESNYIDLIVGCAANVRFNPGDFIFREGEEANQFFIIREGEIALEIYREGHDPLTVQTLKEGEVLGWAWLVPPYRWRLDAQAIKLTRAFGCCPSSIFTLVRKRNLFYINQTPQNQHIFSPGQHIGS